jgi:hypothetical protein
MVGDGSTKGMKLCGLCRHFAVKKEMHIGRVGLICEECWRKKNEDDFI